MRSPRSRRSTATPSHCERGAARVPAQPTPSRPARLTPSAAAAAPLLLLDTARAIISDPVLLTATGHVYERSTLIEWFRQAQHASAAFCV